MGNVLAIFEVRRIGETGELGPETTVTMGSGGGDRADQDGNGLYHAGEFVVCKVSHHFEKADDLKDPTAQVSAVSDRLDISISPAT